MSLLSYMQYCVMRDLVVWRFYFIWSKRLLPYLGNTDFKHRHTFFILSLISDSIFVRFLIQTIYDSTVAITVNHIRWLMRSNTKTMKVSLRWCRLSPKHRMPRGWNLILAWGLVWWIDNSLKIQKAPGWRCLNPNKQCLYAYRDQSIYMDYRALAKIFWYLANSC